MIEKGERWFSELLFVAIINLNLGESSVNLRKLFLLIIGKVLLQIHPYWSITSSLKKHQERGSHLCNLCKLLKINLQIILLGFSYAYGTAFSGLQTKLLDTQVAWGIKRSEILIFFFPEFYKNIFWLSIERAYLSDSTKLGAAGGLHFPCSSLKVFLGGAGRDTAAPRLCLSSAGYQVG